MEGRSYIPVLVCAILAFLLLQTNPKFLQGSKYGDKPKNRPDPLMTALVILVIGCLVVYFMNMDSYEGF